MKQNIADFERQFSLRINLDKKQLATVVEIIWYHE